MAQQDFIQQSEDYWLGRLSEAERQALEAEVAADEAAQAELEAYGQLFRGFSALQEEEVSTKLTEWNANWGERDDTELIEAYLLGHLNEKAVTAFEARRENDPVFADAVARQTEVAKSLRAAQTENFSDKLQIWSQQATDREGEEKEEDDAADKNHSARIIPLRWRKLAAAAVVLLVLVIAAQLVMKPNYSDATLAQAAYEAPRSETTMGETQAQAEDAFLKEFAKAHRLFTQGDYGAADAAFERLQKQLAELEMDDFTKNYYSDNVGWNELLSELGSSETAGDFQNRLEQIAANPDHTYQAEAVSLLRKLNSIWR